LWPRKKRKREARKRKSKCLPVKSGASKRHRFLFSKMGFFGLWYDKERKEVI